MATGGADPQSGAPGTPKTGAETVAGGTGKDNVWPGHPNVAGAASAAATSDPTDSGEESQGQEHEPQRPPHVAEYGYAWTRLKTSFTELATLLVKIFAYLLTPAFLVIVFVVLAAFFVSNVASDSTRLTSVEYARGLITLLFSVGTLAIAVLLTISVLFPGDNPTGSKDRFDQGKEILTLLIGIFGTILGFYFGTLKDQAERGKALAAIEARGGEVSEKTVYLDRPVVNDDDLILIRRLPVVERIFLDTSSVTDKGLRYLRDLPNLKFLSLRGARNISATAIKDFKDQMPDGFKVVPSPDEPDTPKPAEAAPITPPAGNEALKETPKADPKALVPPAGIEKAKETPK
jgi:hypothetical protein